MVLAYSENLTKMMEDELSPVEVFSGTDIEAVMVKDLFSLKN